MKYRPQKILILGGTGMIGKAITRQMITDGYQVRVLTRDASKARNLFP